MPQSRNQGGAEESLPGFVQVTDRIILHLGEIIFSLDITCSQTWLHSGTLWSFKHTDALDSLRLT